MIMHVNRKPVKLAVDTHHLLLENAGTKRVTLNLIRQFQKAEDLELLLLRPSYSLKRGSTAFAKIAGHMTRFFWVHLHLPFLCLQKKADVLLSPEFNTPLYAPCKRAVIAHDAHMRAQRNYTSSLWFYLYYIPFIEFAIRRADLIFTVSDFARKQIVELMRLNRNKVIVCYNGIDESFITPLSPKAADQQLPAGLSRGNYILFVGTFETRKNIERLIEAFGILKRSNPRAAGLRLAIAGNAGTSKYSDRSRQIHELIKQSGIAGDVILCGFVSDDDLPALYRAAAIVAFPSLHEGFGLPIIEGFASEVPVLTSNLCSMPEIAGGAAMLCDPYDAADIAEKMEQLIFDPVLRRQLINAGTQRLSEFTWESCAGKMLKSLMAAVKKDGNADPQ